MANYFQALGAAPGCQCRSRPLRGAVARTLRGYRAVGLSGLGLGAGDEVPALVPISDRKAVAAAIRMFQQRRQRAGMGDTAQASSAVSTASSYASVGTAIMPGIGTVIGAVVGAVVGWLSAKKKPVRATAEQVAQCKSTLSEYMGYAREYPDTAIPLDKQQLIDLNWCMDAIHGARVGVRDPRWFAPDVEGVFIPAAKQIVKLIYETPVGATVNLEAISFRDPKGRTIRFSGFSFVNPQFTNLKAFTAQYFQPMAVKMCEETAGKGAPGCKGYYGGEVPEFTRWLYDLLAWAARETLPNISEADLAAASQVAAQTGTAASDVVKAVEQIIGANVTHGQTAALLTPSSTTPPSTAPPLTAPPTTTVPVPAGVLPPQVTPPAVSAPTLPPNASAADIQAALTHLTAQLMQSQAAQSLTQQQAITAAQATAQQWLNAQGVTAPAAAIDATAKAAVTQAGSNAPLWLGLAAAAAFALARPARSRSRSSGRRRR